MIVNTEFGDGLRMYCHECETEAHDWFYDFSEVKDYKEKHGWRSVKNGEEWIDVCKECYLKHYLKATDVWSVRGSIRKKISSS